MPKFNVTLIRPEGFLFSECFREVAETVMYGLRALGHEAEITENTGQADAINIVFGAHLIGPGFRFPSNFVICIYNWEQIGNYETNPHYYELARNSTTWDYSRKNIERWKELGVEAKYVPLGYVPEMTRIDKVEEDIPVLFCGSRNDHRLNILNGLLDSGIEFEWPPPSFGRKRDALIARSKIVLNMHFYKAGILEMSRVGYILANRKAVVSEYSEEVPDGLRAAMAEVPSEKIVDTCCELLHDHAKREELAERGFDIFSKIDERQILEEALG